MLLIGPLEMLYANGVRNARKKRQIIIKDFEKKWAVKMKVCTMKTYHSAFDMEEDYEIIGEFDLWSEAMKCRNDAFEALEPNTFCAIDDPETTHWTISGGNKNIPFTKDTKVVKLWCVFNIDFLSERIKQIEKLETEKMHLQQQLINEKSKKKSKKSKNTVKILKKKIKNLANQIFETRHVMPPGFNPRDPSASVQPGPETSDIQPGVELRYVYHTENDFMPTGITLGPYGAQMTFSNRPGDGLFQPPSDEDEQKSDDIEELD